MIRGRAALVSTGVGLGGVAVAVLSGTASPPAPTDDTADLAAATVAPTAAAPTGVSAVTESAVGANSAAVDAPAALDDVAANVLDAAAPVDLIPAAQQLGAQTTTALAAAAAQLVHAETTGDGRDRYDPAWWVRRPPPCCAAVHIDRVVVARHPDDAAAAVAVVTWGGARTGGRGPVRSATTRLTFTRSGPGWAVTDDAGRTR